MNEELKKFIKFLAVNLLLLSLVLIGYIFIKNQTWRRLFLFRKGGGTIRKDQSDVIPVREPIKITSESGEKTSLFYLESGVEGKTVAPGDIFSLQVIAKTPGKIIDGVEFILTYNPLLAEIKELNQGEFFSLYPQKNIDKEKGEVRVIALQDPNQQRELREEIVVTLSVEALSKGELNFNFKEEKNHMAGYGGEDFLEKTIPLTVIIK